jgi:glycosyltransferase involved in cell wall biosynthesis
MGKRVAMVVFSYYLDDQRVRREAEALIEAGMSVDVFSLRENGKEKRSRVNDVEVYRLPLERKRLGKLNYIWEYSLFVLLAFVTLSYRHLRKRYHVIHVHNMPDILVISALIPKLTGAKVVLDLHDPMPEIYITKFKVDDSHPLIRFITFLEKWCIRFADMVLTPNIAFRELFISRGCPPSKIHIVMNTAQENVFTYDSGTAPANKNNGFVIMYHGTMLAHNGLDLALEAVSGLRDKIPSLEFRVYGDGDFKDEFLRLVNKMGLNSMVKYSNGQRPVEEIAEAIKSIDLGVIPNKMTPFTNLNMPVRIFEYLAMKKPVVAPCTKGISDYFDDSSLLLFEPGRVDSLTDVILRAYRDPSWRQLVLNRGLDIYEGLRWGVAKKDFVDLEKNV